MSQRSARTRVVDGVTVRQVKCFASVGWLPNNLSASGDFVSYLHSERPWIVQNDEKETWGKDRAGTAKVAVPDVKDPMQCARFVSFTVGSEKKAVTLLAVGTVGGKISLFDESWAPCEQTTFDNKYTDGANAKSGKLTLGDRPILSLASDGTSTLYAGSADGSVVVLRVGESESSGKFALSYVGRLKASGTSAAVTAVALYGEQRLVAALRSGSLCLWDTGKSTLLDTVGEPLVEGKEEYEKPCNSLCVQGDFVVAGFSTGHLRVYGVVNDQIRKVMEASAHTREINQVCAHPKRSLIAVCSRDAHVSVWELPTSLEAFCDQSGLVKQGMECKRVLLLPNRSIHTGIAFVGDNHDTVVVSSYDSKYMSLFSVRDALRSS